MIPDCPQSLGYAENCERLSNGAYVIGKFYVSTSNRWVVLATWTKPGHPEYITWLYDEVDGIFWGHYFSTLTKALHDFTTRIAEDVYK